MKQKIVWFFYELSYRIFMALPPGTDIETFFMNVFQYFADLYGKVLEEKEKT